MAFSQIPQSRFKALVAFLAILAISLCSVALGKTTRADDAPGKYSYYALVLSWSPTYCATQEDRKQERQCSGARPYAFVLHGLWPQNKIGWPQFCRTARPAFVPNKLVAAMLDIMPARALVIHEYRKHGTCTGLSPEAYFRTARRLFEAVTIPVRYVAPRQFLSLTPQQIKSDFLAANAGLNADMIAISCGRGRRLRDLRICFSREMKPQACGANENQARLCRLSRVILPPIREKPDH